MKESKQEIAPDQIKPIVPDTFVIGMSSDGMHEITAGSLAQVFNSTENQARLAMGCMLKFPSTVNAPLLLSWMSDPEAIERFKIWCVGKGYSYELTKQDSQSQKECDPLIIPDKELIDALSSSLTQRDLARILAIRKYRNADQNTLNTLVSGHYRLLQDYLGPRRYIKRPQTTLTPLPLPDLPDELFDDQLIANVLASSELQAIRPIFVKSWHEGEQYLKELYDGSDHPAKKRFVKQLIDYWQAVKRFQVPGFKSHIYGTNKDVAQHNKSVQPDFEFPGAHQKEYAYRFTHKEIGPLDMLIADTGTGKTKGAQYATKAVKAAGSQTTMIVCPAHLRTHWKNELEESLEKPPHILTIRSKKQLLQLTEHEGPRPDYIILSFSLLSMLQDQESALLDELVAKYQADSLIVDEQHLAKTPDAKCTRNLVQLSTLLEEKAPRIVMTATGLINTVEDLDAPIRVLLPRQYQNTGDFTRAARNDPYLVSAYLHGKDLLTRWRLADIIPDLPAVQKTDIPVPISYFHQALYEFIHQDNTSESQVKRTSLRLALLDPNLIRKYYIPTNIERDIKRLERIYQQEADEQKQQQIQARIDALNERLSLVQSLLTPDQAHQQLLAAHHRFMEWKLTTHTNEIFNEDFLVKAGFDRLAIWAFIHYKHGMTDFIQQINDPVIEEDWQPEKIISSKYRALKTELDKINLTKTKVYIFSSFYKTEVTQTGKEFKSLYDHLCDWYGKEKIVVIDGDSDLNPKRNELSEREQARQKLRLDPSTIGLLTTRSSRLGIDLTVPDTEANKYIDKVVSVVLDAEETNADNDQRTGRVRRRGQRLPLEELYLKATNMEQPTSVRYGFIDHSMWEAVEYKRLLAEMTIDGIPLTEDEEKFYKEHTSKLRMEAVPMTPRMYFLRHFWSSVRGQGFAANRRYFTETGFEGMSNADFFASYYNLMENGHYNARAIAEIIKRHQSINSRHTQIGSIGSGNSSLQRVLGQTITNVDMLEDILLEARAHQTVPGSYLGGNIAELPLQNRVFDITDASLVLHWTSNQSYIRDSYYTTERIQALMELHRITKENGLISISLPDSYLTSSQFKEWVSALQQYFGFKLADHLPSGQVIATDYRTEPISWVLNFVKAKPLNPLLFHDSLDITNLRRKLMFDFETISKLIDGDKKRKQEYRLSIQPPVPHQEFEIISPLNGQTEKIVYTPNQRSVFETTQSLVMMPETIMELHTEEYGLFRRLKSLTYSDEIAFRALHTWMVYGQERHNPHRIWTELLSIVKEVSMQ